MPPGPSPRSRPAPSVSAGAPAGAADNAVLDEAAFAARIRSAAKHRQLIAAPRVNDGAPLQFVVNTLNGFKTGWNEPDANVQIALVLFGSAVTIGLDDEAWRTYKLADIVKHVQQEFLTVDAAQGESVVAHRARPRRRPVGPGADRARRAHHPLQHRAGRRGEPHRRRRLQRRRGRVRDPSKTARTRTPGHGHRPGGNQLGSRPPRARLQLLQRGALRAVTCAR